MRNALLDTGPFVALLDKSEHNHERCADFFREFRGKIFTTEPVLTETLYLLNSTIRGQRNGIDFIVQGGAALVPQSRESLSRAMVLMEKYRDIPMDFADATLVVLGEELGIDEVFSLDLKGFGAYRMSGRKAFKVWPK